MGWFGAVAFSADGKQLLSGTYKSNVKIKLWSVTCPAILGHGRPGRWFRIKPMEGEKLQYEKKDLTKLGDITALAFSPKGDLVACATRSRTTTIEVWDIKTGVVQQGIEIDTTISRISFSECGPYLETDKGLVRIPGLSDDTPRGQRPACNIFLRERWIVRDRQDVLWLPPDYRVAYVIIPSSIVVLGHTSGRVTFLEFR